MPPSQSGYQARRIADADGGAIMTTLPTTAKTTERRHYGLPPGIEPAPDIIDDDMPDPMFQHPFFFAIVELLTAFFGRKRPGTLVDGDGPVYYRDADGVQRYVKPDCTVVFDVDTDYIYARNGYFIEEMGKPPNFVMEIASTTTADNDTGHKRDLYESMGVSEYFGFDRTGGEFYGVPLFGWRLRDGEYVPVETTLDSDGATWAYSQVLGLSFRAARDSLKMWDPERGEFLYRLQESERARRQSERARRESERARERLESELRVERMTLSATRRSLQAEREARQAEREADAARIRELEERLRGEEDDGD